MTLAEDGESLHFDQKQIMPEDDEPVAAATTAAAGPAGEIETD